MGCPRTVGVSTTLLFWAARMAGEARWHGDDYQSRFFWLQAASLQDPQATHVVEVAFEAKGPKAFDDVVVRYDPNRRSTGAYRVSVDHYQIKWHVNRSGRFGFDDLTKPEFINATRHSILERLRDAKAAAPKDAAFHLITTDGIADGDQLGKLLSAEDGSLLIDRLFNSKTDASTMGKVRRSWREHLGLEDDDELRPILEGFHIQAYHEDLEKLRDRAADRLRIVGLVAGDQNSAFQYDAVARTLAFRDINHLSRASFKALVDEEGWRFERPPPVRTNVALRSFSRSIQTTELLETRDENTLDVSDRFEGRHLKEGAAWEELRTTVSGFLDSMLAKDPSLRLYFDTHASIMFLAGSVLGIKSGADVELRQRQRAAPTRNWHVADGAIGPDPVVGTEIVGEGSAIVLAIGLTRAETFADVREYVAANLPAVGTIIIIEPAAGPSQNAVAGGAHAARLADLATSAVAKVRKPGAEIHVFASAPNAFLFLLGQQTEAMGTCILYEFDFGGKVDSTYRPTFKI